MDGRATPEIWEGEGCRAIAPVIGSEEGEQRRILRDGQGLATAQGPASRLKVEASHHDFANKRIHKEKK
jgi:hypothetical protein